MKKFIKYIKGNWIATILAPIFIMIDTFGMIVQPYYTSKIIDIGIPNKDVNYIIRTGILMAVLSIISIAGGFFAMFFSSKAAYGFGANLRKEMIAKIQEFSFSNINKFTTSSLITRLTNDIEVLTNLFQMILRITIRAPFMLVGGVISMLILSPKLSLIFLALLPILVILALIIVKKSFPLFKQVQEKIDKVNTVIRENLIGARVIKSFVREDFENKRFEKANNELMQTFIKSFKIILLLMPTIMLIMNLAIAAVLWVGGNGLIDVGAISASITYMVMSLISLVMLSVIFMNFSRAKASSDRIIEVIKEEPDIINKVNKEQSPKIKNGKIEYNIEKFEFLDSKGEPILENIKFDINSGETVAIIGSTGTGKSTLVNLIPRFYDVTKGYVKIDDVDVKDYNLEILREEIGMVLQENRLFKGTVEENIKWGKKDATIEEIQHACKIAQIDKFIESLPDKYLSKVEQRGANFSGGQKQRLSIARALIKQPKILILDDSVSALDATTEMNLKKALKNELKNTTIIFIVQKISSCKDADKVIVMDDGTVVGVGKHEELLANNKVYQEISNSQKEIMAEQ